MTLPASGNSLSLNQILQEKQGNTTARTNISLKGLSVDGVNDSSGGDITGTPNGSAPYAISEFFGYTQVTDSFPATGEDSWFQLGGLGGDAPEASGNNQWGNKAESGSGYVQAFTNLGFKHIEAVITNGVVTTLGYIQMRWTTGGSSAASSFSYSEIDYEGYDSTTFQAKCDYATQLTGGSGTGISADNPTSYSPASGTFANVSKSTYSPIWQWSVERNSNSNAGVTRIRSTHTGGTNPDWTVRAGGTGAESISGPARTIDLFATRSGFGGGPGGGGGGGFVCIHEDHLIQTESGLMHVDDLVEKAPRIWSYDKVNKQNVLSRLRRVEIVKHDNLYKINNMRVTEDHVLYTENYTPVSVNPTKAKENYNIDSTEIKVGDKLMKFDGSLEEVTSIAVYEGTHRTYTLYSQRDYNFYADGVLVDSEMRPE